MLAGIHPHVCCFIAISTTFSYMLESSCNSTLITFSALSDVFHLYGITTGHVHFMTRGGGGGYALVLITLLK